MRGEPFNQQLLVKEIFHSLQGETSLSGVRFAFIRLTGCNLRCSYCDSAYAFKGGALKTITEITEEIRPFCVDHVLITGGEPLMQRPTPALARTLSEKGFQVSIETHGETSIEKVAPLARIIMDIKTPSSEMCRGGFVSNIPFLKPQDEVKFVIGSSEDYDWAKGVLQKHRFPVREILFSPVVPSCNPQWLAESILRDRLPVRLQLQLHKQIWGADRTGV